MELKSILIKTYILSYTVFNNSKLFGLFRKDSSWRFNINESWDSKS